MRSKFLFALAFSTFLSVVLVFGQARRPAPLRSVTIVTEPNAVVWIDDIKRGATDENGKLVVKPVPNGTHKMRVRATGFKEISTPLLPAQKGEMKIALTKTADAAEILFQQAETAADRAKAAELYRRAIAARPVFAEAQLGLARTLSASGDSEGALKAISDARKARANYAEASAAEGRIYKSEDDEEKAIASFKRAITEGKGFQPEAHTGLGLLYRDRAEAEAAAGKFEDEKADYALAASELKTAVAQLSGAPDAVDVYQLLGAVYEKAQKFPQAIALYEEFLRLFPDASEAVTVRSYIVQLKKQINGEQ